MASVTSQTILRCDFLKGTKLGPKQRTRTADTAFTKIEPLGVEKGEEEKKMDMTEVSLGPTSRRDSMHVHRAGGAVSAIDDACSRGDDVQAILCAELLSSLASCRMSEKTPTMKQTDQQESITAPRQIESDPEVIDFIRRITFLANRTGVTPPLVLSCVLSESMRTEMRQDARPAGAIASFSDEWKHDHIAGWDIEDPLNGVLYNMVWQAHLRNADFNQANAGMKAVHHFRQITSDSIINQKERIRKEKLRKWKEKRKIRDFSSKIRYPARQQLANARKRHKGQFVSNNPSMEK